jgi:hypothetical protein
MRTLLLIVATLSFVALWGCSQPPLSKSEYIKQQMKHEHKAGDPETLPSGYIRDIHFQQRLLMFESDDGYTRILGPVCKHPDMLPVWVGEHVYQINFRWVPRYVEGDEVAGECYVLDWVGHDPSKDIHQSATPKDASGVTK